MSKPEIVIVVARADNGAIGKDGSLPWHIPADLKRFKALTMGAPMLMGRKTFESLPGLLPGRRHIVLTRDRAWGAEGAEVVHTIQGALALADERLSVIGGAEIFAATMGIADRIELTQVHAEPAADTFMPAPDPAQWREVSRDRNRTEDGRVAFSYIRLERIGASGSIRD